MASAKGMSETETDTKGRLILYPSPGMGHLVSMFELAKLLVAGHGFSVTIIIVEPTYNTGSTAPFIASASAANPSISFHRLPAVTPPPTSSRHREALALSLLRLSNPNLLDYLRSSGEGEVPPLKALIVDFFCTCALEVAAELSLPCYVFYTSPATFLAVYLYLPVLHSRSSLSFRDLAGTPLHVPGVPAFRADHMPFNWLDRDDDSYRGFLRATAELPDTDGIIVNTFDALEPRALAALSSGELVIGKPTPPVFSIGPLIMPAKDDSSSSCFAWLNSQPEKSVVFLCFGSLGVFSAEQVKEIAVGLEGSGQRFLWVVRSPPSEDESKKFEKPPEPDLEALLPEGFLERTAGVGMVVPSWAPQAAVLRHEAVGGFVSHCGWNSVLEAVCAGVPMLAWPLYAEQHVNKVFLVEEARLAAEVRGYHDGVVPAAEVEERVRWLMEDEGGRKLAARMAAVKAAAEAAVTEGGSSYKALLEVAARLCRAELSRH